MSYNITSHLILDPRGNPHRLCLISYTFPTGQRPKVLPHGNSKKETPFYPTFPSTKSLIKSKVGTGGPKHIMSTVSKSVGGVMSALSPCDLPRSERQINYLQRTTKCSGEEISAGKDPFADQVFAMMQQAKLGDKSGLFIRETRPSPEPAFVVAHDCQLNDLVRFCTVPGNFSILTIDPTFNLGDFDVTPVTYRHQLLESVRYGTLSQDLSYLCVLCCNTHWS